MPIAFNVDRMLALGRSGVLRLTGTSEARIKTPVFIPTLHIPLLDVPAYNSFIEQLVKDGIMRIALVPPQLRPSSIADAIEKHAFLNKIALLAGSSGAKPYQVPPCMEAFPILRAPFPSVALDPASARRGTESLLDAVNREAPGTPGPVALAIDDHGFAEVMEEIDAATIGARAWALAITDFDTGSYAVDVLVRKAAALHERFRLDLFRAAWTGTTPQQFSHLVAAGFDAVIESGWLDGASKGIYCFPDRSLAIRELTELPCHCPHCKRLVPPDGTAKLATLDDHVALYCHNIAAAFDEMARVRQELRLRTFRDHLEARNHGSALLATFLRKLDARSGPVAVMATDLSARAPVNFIGTDSYTRPEVLKFRHKVINDFHVPPRARWMVLLPCSARKPYSTSPSHARFLAAMGRGWKDWRRHCTELILTSPIGIVPRQLERCFPAAHYDVPVTGYWDEQELRFSATMLEAIVAKCSVEGPPLHGIIAHVDGGYRAACELAEKGLSIPVTFTGAFGSATSKEAIDGLAATMASLEGKVEASGNDKQRCSPQDEDLHVLVDYQLGTHGAGIVLFPSGAKLRPMQGDAVQAIDKATGTPMAVIDGASGHLSIDKKAAARLWQASLADPAIKLKKVRFCDQKIAGSSVFPGGVDHADDSIAVGDDVFVHTRDGRLIAFGTAVVPGRRMKEMHGGPVVAISKKLEGE